MVMDGSVVKLKRRQAEKIMPVLSNQRHEAVAQAFIADPERVGWKASRYPHASQRGAENGFSRLMKKNSEFCVRVAELQQGAAASAEITLQGLLKRRTRIQRAAMEARQYSAANGALKLKAELSGLYVQKKEDVTPKRSQEQIDAELRELLAGGYAPEAGRATGGTPQPGSSQPGQRQPDRVH